MIKSLLISSILAFSSSVALVNKAPFKPVQAQSIENIGLEYSNPGYGHIDYESPAYRLGDYDIVELDHMVGGGGQVRYSVVQAVIPRVVFDTLGQYENVFIYIPLYDYNPAVDLTMRIDFYFENEFLDPVYCDIENIPLSMTMLKVLPYTMVDLPYNINVFDASTWDNDYHTELRLTFTIPYKEYTTPPGDYASQLRNLTIFTKRGDGYAGGYDDGYFDGYTHGYEDGEIDGYTHGNNDGLLTGYDDGYSVGYNDGISADFNAFSWLTAIFSAMGAFLSIQLLPSVSIGGVVILVMVLTLLPFLIGLLKGGKN